MIHLLCCILCSNRLSGLKRDQLKTKLEGKKSGFSIVKIREIAKFDIEVILMKCLSGQENTFEILCRPVVSFS